MMQPILYAGLWTLTGYLLMTVLTGDRRRCVSLCGAYPLGVAVWGVTYLSVRTILGPLNQPVHLYLYIAGVIGLLVFLGFKGSWGKQRVLDMIGLTLVSLTLGIVFSRLNLVVFGRDIFLSHYLDFDQSQFRGLPVFLHAFMPEATGLAAPYIPYLWPMTAVSLAGLTGCIAWLEGRRQGIGGGWLTTVALLPAALLFSSYLMILGSVYYNLHIMTATLLVLFIAFVWVKNHDAVPEAAWGALLILVTVSLIRMEGPLIAMALFIMHLAYDKDEKPAFRSRIVWFTLLVLLWQINVLLRYTGEESFVSVPLQAAIVFGTAIAGVTLYLLTGLNKPKQNLALLVRVIGVGLGAGFLVLLLARPGHMLISTLHIIQNLLVSGYWGLFWWVVLFAGVNILCFRTESDSFDRYLLINLLVPVGIITVLGGLRIPYRLQWGDSANRMMIHFAPFAALWLSVGIAGMRPGADAFASLHMLQARAAMNRMAGFFARLMIITAVGAFVLATRISATTYSDVMVALKLAEQVTERASIRMAIVPAPKMDELAGLGEEILENIRNFSGER